MNNDAIRKIPFFKPDITDNEINSIADAIKNGPADSDQLVKRYERSFSELVKSPYTVAVNSTLSALLLSLKALGIKEGDEVITSSYTIPGIGEALEHSNASIVFTDIDPITFNTPPALIENKINHNTKAVIIFDTVGLRSQIGNIMKLALSNGIYVINCTFYNPYEQYFYKSQPNPHITIFCSNERFAGGAVIATDMENTHLLMRSLCKHGIKPSNDGMETDNWYYQIVSPGFDCRMTGIQSAFHISYIKMAEYRIKRRRHIADSYNSLLKSADDKIILPFYGDSHTSHTWQLYIIRLVKNALNISRDEFIKELAVNGVEASVHYIPLHIHPYYSKKYKYKYYDLPETYEAYTSAVSLPIYASMNDEDVRYASQLVINLLKRYSE